MDLFEKGSDKKFLMLRKKAISPSEFMHDDMGLHFNFPRPSNQGIKEIYTTITMVTICAIFISMTNTNVCCSSQSPHYSILSLQNLHCYNFLKSQCWLYMTG